MCEQQEQENERECASCYSTESELQAEDIALEILSFEIGEFQVGECLCAECLDKQ